MSKGIQAKITTVGRPLRVEMSLDGPWLERLKSLLRDMDPGNGSYSVQRYLEELVEADIVYREGIGSRGPFVARSDIVEWLQRRHAGRKRAAGGSRR